MQISQIEQMVAAGQLAQALALADALLAQDAGQAMVWHVKGGIHEKLGDKAAALQCFNQAMQRKPDFAEACFDLARMLEETGKVVLAIQVYQHLLQLAPQHKGAGRLVALRSGVVATQLLEQAFAVGNDYLNQGRNAEAVQAYLQAMAIRSDVPEVLCNLGVAFMRLQRLNDAEQALKNALQLRPKFVDALNALGNVYKDKRDQELALECYRKCVNADASYAFGWVNLGKLYQEMERHEEAVNAYEKGYALTPGHAETIAELLHRLNYLCRWDKVAQLRQQLEDVLAQSQQFVVPFLAALYCTADTQKGNAMRWAASHYPLAVPCAMSPLPAEAGGSTKLRIGYVSADYHRNATAFLISELFERHDRERFEVIAYSAGLDDESDERKRIVKAVDTFRIIRDMDDATAAQAIRQDGIDILVDLKGYTSGNRMGMMSLRPAPLQVHYLGYPGTTGASFIDYFISDAVCSPEGEDAVFTEKLVRMPFSYQINDRHRALPKGLGKRAEYGLPEEGLVLCDFNQSYKITPEIFGVWMKVLEAVPGSVLWLFETIPEATIHLRAKTKARGIDPARIVTAQVAAPAVHLERYAHADLFLDTFPVCGHTTASDALWCGVPVVTLKGKNFASRVSASLLSAVGLSELVANDMAEYEALALAVAQDKARLQAFKAYLQDKRMSLPLFDTALTTRAMEAAFGHMVALQRARKALEAFTINSDCNVV